MADHGCTSEQLWTIRAPVLERRLGAEIHPGGTVFTPTLRLTGRYDGGRLVLTEPATLGQDRAYPPRPTRRRTGRVLLWVVAAGPEQTQFLLDRYGPHLVVESWLEPVPPR